MGEKIDYSLVKGLGISAVWLGVGSIQFETVEPMVSLLSVLSSRNFTEGGFKEVKSKFLLLNDLVKIMQR